MSAWTKPYMPRSGERGSISWASSSALAEVAQPRLEPDRLLAGDGRQPVQREGLAEHGRVLEQRPVGRVEAVEPRGDERLERLRHGQLAEVADRLVAAVGLAQPPVGRRASGRSRPRTAGCRRRGR